MVRHRFTRQLQWAFALSVLAACAQDSERVGASDSDLLPNSAVFELGHDGETYRRIADAFAAKGLDLHVDTTAFAPAWPLTDAKPTVLNRHGTPMLYASFGYFHSGLDVLRSDGAVSKDVVAPHDGVAMVFDWAGNRIDKVTAPYATIVAVYDPVSHVVTELLHVAALDAIAKSAEPFAVTKGTILGQLAPAPLAKPTDADRLANTQVVFVDGEKKTLLNPATFFADYTDTVAPTFVRGYATDETGAAVDQFVSGKLDLVVEVADRDSSNRNFEVSALSYKVEDQNGKVLSSAKKCSLDALYESIAEGSTFRALDVVDFGTALAAGQAKGAWPDSDVDNINRTFRYALTNLQSKSGKCVARSDADAALEVGNKATKLTVSVTLWDVKGNETTASFDIERNGPAPADEEDAGDDDAAAPQANDDEDAGAGDAGPADGGI